MIGARVVWDQRFTSYDFGAGHPMHPSRLDLTHRLAAQLGLWQAADLEVVPAEGVSEEVLRQLHTSEYVAAVQRYSTHPQEAHGAWGIGTDDTPAFLGMHESTALAVGATVDLARGLASGEAAHGVNIAGGLHHAMADHASGFCIYNDAVLGIQQLLAGGATKVAYVDIDAHHGDGVERAFWDDPRVMTVSLHETGACLFPGTGFPGDTGGPNAPDSAINVALPPGTSDAGWLRAFHAVVPAVLRAFEPEVLVTQHGCDGHRKDPLAHLSLTVDAMQAATVALHDLAHELCEGRWLALGGGGYELVDVVPLAWSHLIAVAAHRPIGLTEPVPSAWREYVRDTYEQFAPTQMGERSGEPINYGLWSQGYHPEDTLDNAVMATRAAVFPGLGLDPFFD